MLHGAGAKHLNILHRAHLTRVSLSQGALREASGRRLAAGGREQAILKGSSMHHGSHQQQAAHKARHPFADSCLAKQAFSLESIKWPTRRRHLDLCGL